MRTAAAPIRAVTGFRPSTVSPVADNFPDPVTEWQPATSEPGELFTPEGRIRAAGAFGRGLQNRDPRLKAYRRSMMRVSAMVIAIGCAFALVAVLVL
jgi:hypothetical protein